MPFGEKPWRVAGVQTEPDLVFVRKGKQSIGLRHSYLCVVDFTPPKCLLALNIPFPIQLISQVIRNHKRKNNLA